MALPDSSNHSQLVDERCARHQFEAALDRCRQCGIAFCGECLVYSFGERQPPFCIPCALAAAGVRSGAGRTPALPKKEIRRREKEIRRAAKEAEDVAAAQAAGPQIDWSLPIVATGSASPNGNGHQPGNGQGPSADPTSNGNGSAPHGAPPPPGQPGDASTPGSTTFPSFDDAPTPGRPQAPATPPTSPSRSGLFGRKKSKAVPF